MTKATNRPAGTIRGALRVAGFAAATAVATAAGAQGTGEGGWQLEATAYLWATSMKGDVQSPSLPRTSVDLSFGDILDKLDFGLMGALEARKGRWGLLFDGMYMKVSDSAVASRPLPGPIPGALTARADATVRQTGLAGAAAYRVIDGATSVDAIAGLRYNAIDVSANIDASLFALAGTVHRSGDKDWWDPYLGARVTHRVDDRWSLVGYVDVGGFGVGSDSTWQAMAGVNYAFTKTVIGKIAYRYLSVDYDRGGFTYDMKNAGILIGVGTRF